MKKILHGGLCCTPGLWNGFQQAFVDVIGKENYSEVSTSHSDFNQRMREMFDLNNPDIVFLQIQAENIIDPSLCDYMKSKGAFIINWTGDKRHTVPQWMVEIAPHVSVTSFSNMEDVNKMRALGYNSEYLEIGYDPEIYKPEGEAHNVPEIVFMGNNYGDGHFPMSKFRREMMEFLQKEYGSRFGVYGTGWPNANGNFNHSQHEEAKAYRGAKVAINVSHFDCERYNSDRLLRILGTGTACISYTHEGMHNSLATFFFETFEELKSHIDDVLSWNKEAIESEGIELNRVASSEFTFKHQVQNILKLTE